MIALDTNVLLRYLLNDDKAQSAKARRLVRKNDSILLTDVVLVETVWTLRGKRYAYDKGTICEVITRLFEEPAICFEDDQAVWRALMDYRNAKPVRVAGKVKIADFADALIVNKAKDQVVGMGQPFEGLYTFDAGARELPGTLKP